MIKANGLSQEERAYYFMYDYAVLWHWKSLLRSILSIKMASLMVSLSMHCCIK